MDLSITPRFSGFFTGLDDNTRPRSRMKKQKQTSAKALADKSSLQKAVRWSSIAVILTSLSIIGNNVLNRPQAKPNPIQKAPVLKQQEPSFTISPAEKKLEELKTKLSIPKNAHAKHEQIFTTDSNRVVREVYKYKDGTTIQGTRFFGSIRRIEKNVKTGEIKRDSGLFKANGEMFDIEIRLPNGTQYRIKDDGGYIERRPVPKPLKAPIKGDNITNQRPILQKKRWA